MDYCCCIEQFCKEIVIKSCPVIRDLSGFLFSGCKSILSELKSRGLLLFLRSFLRSSKKFSILLIEIIIYLINQNINSHIYTRYLK